MGYTQPHEDPCCFSQQSNASKVKCRLYESIGVLEVFPPLWSIPRGVITVTCPRGGPPATLCELWDLHPLGSSRSTAWILHIYFKPQLIKSRLISRFLWTKHSASCLPLPCSLEIFLPFSGLGGALSKRQDIFRKMGVRNFWAQERSSLGLLLCSKLCILL